MGGRPAKRQKQSTSDTSDLGAHTDTTAISSDASVDEGEGYLYGVQACMHGVHMYTYTCTIAAALPRYMILLMCICRYTSQSMSTTVPGDCASGRRRSTTISSARHKVGAGSVRLRSPLLLTYYTGPRATKDSIIQLSTYSTTKRGKA